MTMPNNTKNMLNPELTARFHARAPATIAKIARVIEAANGVLTIAARELGIAPETLRRWAKTEPKIAEAVERGRIAAVKAARLTSKS